jgi:hypothetical protein
MFEKMKLGQRCLVQDEKDLAVFRSIHPGVSILFREGNKFPAALWSSLDGEIADAYVAGAEAKPEHYEYLIPPVDPIPDGYEPVFDASTPRSKGMQYFSQGCKKWREIDFGSHNVKLFQDEYYIKPKEKTEPAPVQEDVSTTWQSGEFKKIKPGQKVFIRNERDRDLFLAINPEYVDISKINGFRYVVESTTRVRGVDDDAVPTDCDYVLPDIAQIPRGYEPVLNNAHHPYVPGMMYWSNASRKWDKSYSPGGPLACLYYIKPKTQSEPVDEGTQTTVLNAKKIEDKLVQYINAKDWPVAAKATDPKVEKAGKVFNEWIAALQKKFNNDFWVDADTVNKLCSGFWTMAVPQDNGKWVFAGPAQEAFFKSKYPQWPVGNGPTEYDKMNPMITTQSCWSHLQEARADRSQEIKEVIQLALENLR